VATEAVGGTNPQPMANGSGTGAGEFFNSVVYMQDAASGNWFTWNGTNFVGPVTAPTPPSGGGGTGGGGTGGSPPAVAAAQGFNLQTFGAGGLLLGNTLNPTTSFPTVTSDTNIYPFTFFGTSWRNIGVTVNSDGSITMDGTGQAFGNGLSTAIVGSGTRSQTNIQGIAFGGGGYFQCVMSGNGPMSFWANDIENMNGTSQGLLNAVPSWIETDIAEFDFTNRFGWAIHNWFLSNGPTSAPGGPTGDVAPNWGGPIGTPTINTPNGEPWSPPAGVDFTQPNTYAMLWVPATATEPGFIQIFFNNEQVGNTLFWNQFNPSQAFPPVAGNVIDTVQNSLGPVGQTVPNTAWNVIDTRHLAFIFGAQTGGGDSVTIHSFDAWQPSNANNIINGGAPNGTGSPPIVITPTTPTGVTAGVPFTFQGGLSGETSIPTLTASVNGAPPITLTGAGSVFETGWSAQFTIFTTGATTIVVSDGSGHTGTTASFTVNPGTETASGTAVTTVGPLINASPTPGIAGSGNFLGITSGGQLSLNGTVPTAFAGTANVIEIFYNNNHQAFQKNSSGNWYGPISATSSGIATSSPLPVETIVPTTPTGVTAGLPFAFQGMLEGYPQIPTLTFSVNGGTPAPLTGVTLSGWSEIITIANASTGDVITVTDGQGNSGVTASFVVSAGSVSVGAGPGGAGGAADNGSGGAGGRQVFSFSSQTFTNVSTTQTFSLTQGVYAVTVSATFNSGSVTLQQLSPDGVTFVTVLPAFTAKKYAVIALPAGQYQLAITGATAVFAEIAIATNTSGNPGQSNSLGGGGGSGSGGNVTGQDGGAGGWPGGGGGGGGSGSTSNLGGAGAGGLLALSQPQPSSTNTATVVANIKGVVAKITATSINPASIVSNIGAASAKATALVVNPARVNAAIGAVTAVLQTSRNNLVTVNAAIGAVTTNVVATATNTATVNANIGAVTAATLIPMAVNAPIGAMTAAIVAGATNPANVSANIVAMTAAIVVPNQVRINVTIPSLTATVIANSINAASVVAAIGPATARIIATPTNVAVINANIGAMTAQIFSDFSTSAVVAASVGRMTAAIIAAQRNPVTIAAETGATSATITVGQTNPVSVSAETGALTSAVHATSTNPATINARIGAVTAAVSAASRNVVTVNTAIGGMTASALLPTVAIINANIGAVTADVQIVLGNKAVITSAIGAVSTTAQASSTNFAMVVSEIGPITADIQTLLPNFAAINANLGAMTMSAMILFPIQVSVDAEIGAMTAAIRAEFIPLPPPGRTTRPPFRHRPVHIHG
jgi:hypothetical protein